MPRILSWRGPRGWSRWHLVSGDATLCHLDVPEFAPMLLTGPTAPDDDRVCLTCRERYSQSAAVAQTLAILDEPRYRPRAHMRWWPVAARVLVALSPLLVLLLYDFFVTPPLFHFTLTLPQLAVGVGATGVNGGLFAAVLRNLARRMGG